MQRFSRRQCRASVFNNKNTDSLNPTSEYQICHLHNIMTSSTASALESVFVSVSASVSVSVSGLVSVSMSDLVSVVSGSARLRVRVRISVSVSMPHLVCQCQCQYQYQRSARSVSVSVSVYFNAYVRVPLSGPIYYQYQHLHPRRTTVDWAAGD